MRQLWGLSGRTCVSAFRHFWLLASLTFSAIGRNCISGVSSACPKAAVHTVVVMPLLRDTTRSPSRFSIKNFLLHTCSEFGSGNARHS